MIRCRPVFRDVGRPSAVVYVPARRRHGLVHVAYALAALREFVPATQVLFGSDFPLAWERVVQEEISGLETSEILDDARRRAIDRDNALALFPRFANRP